MIRLQKLTVVNAACSSGVAANFSVDQRSGRSGRCKHRLHSTPLVVEVSECFSARLCARKAGSTQSVTVGPNVDVSNEPGPQSETSIAIDPNHPSQLVAGSNEIDRLPMRGYFSSDGGLTWGGVDLPLPPPLTPSGADFGSDPGVAWDTRGNVYYSYIVVFFNGGFNGCNRHRTSRGAISGWRPHLDTDLFCLQEWHWSVQRQTADHRRHQSEQPVPGYDLRHLGYSNR